jgi:hypothetical protein
MLQKCQEIVDKLALFSRNEEKDDISTGDLKYLLVRNQLHRKKIRFILLLSEGSCVSI